MIGQPDPARAELLRALDQAEQRVNAATGGILRCICGRLSWHAERTRRFRVDLERAVVDMDAVTRALTALDQIDAECDEPGGLP